MGTNISVTQTPVLANAAFVLFLEYESFRRQLLCGLWDTLGLLTVPHQD